MATAYGPDTRDPRWSGAAGPGDGSPLKRLLPAALRAPFEGRTWRALLYQVLSVPVGLILFGFSITLTSFGVGMLITFLGVPILAGTLALCRGFGAVERERARVLLGVDVAAPEPVRGRTGGLMSWMGASLKNGASWRHLLYSVVQFPWALISFSLALPLWMCGWTVLTYPLWYWVLPARLSHDGLQVYSDAGRTVYVDTPVGMVLAFVTGLVLVLVTAWLVRGLAHVDRALVRGLLGPSRLATRVSELETDRGVVVDTAAADLRRIERDLHDGAQARLVALAMDLGLAKEKLNADPEAAARMVDEAHGEVKIALQELRDLARGIHPAVLTDRGLDAALSAIASRCTVPVTVTVDLPERPVQAIEGIAYFTVSELLQNVSKHSAARSATVEVWRTGDRLMLQVTDDGRGGADPSAGSGLAGLAERLDAVDGVLAVDSPQGGPTRITAELPWRG
ncbi:sensor domain-containing protein [Streptomyces sp. NPDC052095]|uniref:sensor histidine kinase n=1 Tax=unclassified Streptomyces TaxID=2593676 RepID=UPI00344D8694